MNVSPEAMTRFKARVDAHTRKTNRNAIIIAFVFLGLSYGALAYSIVSIAMPSAL